MCGQRKKIDWAETKRRLQESQRGLDLALAGDQERTEAVYLERAAQLAGRQSQVNAPAAALRVLVFSLGEERYGLALDDVVELLPFGNCTPVPGATPELLGVTNVHGEIRSVVDLGRLLELPESASDTPGYILLVRRQGLEVGLRVDSIDRIQVLAPGQLAAPGEAEVGARLRYLKGLTQDRLRLLDTEALFSHPVFTKGSS